ncbi:conserved hypothetical protein [Parafrankia sp. EAN1pec]|uniref:hypothetical protein n=1 Tax=Parafrankia sp. (strain EAN1pec) TaxID=298653 RepID=UPI0000544575|nr:conserved hypothetical protein [Frankia sp. EAN1pec]
MNETMPGIRRLCIAVAAYDNGREGPLPEGSPASPPLGAVLDETCAAADVRCAHWVNRPTGGELAVFPPGIDEDRVVSDFVRELRRTLVRVNAESAPRLRLRVALHQGITRVDEQGYGGRAVVKACRLRDADILDRELAEHPESDLVLIVSGELFDDVTGDDVTGDTVTGDTVTGDAVTGDDVSGAHPPDLCRADFRPVTLDVPESGQRALAWVLAPAPPPTRPALAWRRPAERDTSSRAGA